ncbi:hypothetical protein Bca52824_046077 [Brassica carinata]|uniref:DUF4283 domain-containing protein n=1 Tax=Brassica carinata TaxID=52824 RepID=A0A8X7RGH4_BRACI|nr:hypothetical protein Bca52824_046077 [Brassica carinata]
MAENLRRGMQDINLGADEPSIPLPVNVVNEAMAANHFILIGRPVMPRRQNIRSIIATLPHNWGHVGVYGRMIEGRQFQFVFPSEESLEVVLRSGPWAFSDRMLILERWTPSFNLLMLNFIPFWIQIRGMPIQFKSQDIVMHIGRALGMYLDVDYIPEVAARRDYNGNLNHDGDDEDSDGNNGGEHDVPNRGVIIEEIHEVEPNGDANVVQEENVQEKVEEEEDDLHEENANEYDELWSNQAMQTMYSDELNDEKMNNPINPFGTRRDGKELLKRKSWMESVEGNKLIFNRL